MDKNQISAALTFNVKHCRESLEKSQSAFAEAVGIRRPNLAAIEEGRSMSIENAYKISRYLHVSLDTLLTTNMATGESFESEVHPVINDGRPYSDGLKKYGKVLGIL